MGEKPPVTVELGGRNHTFTYEGTTCHVYRIPEDMVHSHIVNAEYGTQRVFLFDVPRLIMYLTGMEIPGHGLKSKEADRVAEEMDEKYGWNARMIIEDEAPEEIKERHIHLASAILRKEVVAIPREWGG